MFQLLILSILGWHIVGVLSTYDEARLTKHLLDNYERNGSKYARPVNKYDDVPEVLHGLALQSIDIIDPYSDRMVLNVWEYFQWTDGMLKWNPKDFGGVKIIQVPIEKIFQPDIIAYNAERPADRTNTLVLVSNNGFALWVSPSKQYIACEMEDVEWNDNSTEVSCVLKFGSWAYDGNKLNLKSFYGKFDVGTYLPHPEWELVNNTVVRNSAKYDCCDEPYIDIVYTITLKRKLQ